MAEKAISRRNVKSGADMATDAHERRKDFLTAAEIDRLLNAAPGLLCPGGRLVLVAFHSLEDRRIKRFIDAASDRRMLPSRHVPLPTATQRPKLRWLERKVVKPSDAEVARNPRARSARLRAAIRLADDEQAPADHLPALPSRAVHGFADCWRVAA